MPKEVHHGLTPARVRHERKPGRYAGGNGLYLVVSKTGGRWWEMFIGPGEVLTAVIKSIQERNRHEPEASA